MSIPIDSWLPKVGQKASQAGERVQRYGFELSFDCDASETQQLLGPVNEAYNTRVEDLLLTALASSLGLWTEQNTFRFNLENHGRINLDEKLQPIRMVGWLTTYFPLILDIGTAIKPDVSTSNNSDLSILIKRIKEAYREVPDNGLGYIALLHKVADEELISVQQASKPEAVEFNYLGQFDTSLCSEEAFAVASESTGSDIYPDCSPKNPIYVNAIVVSGKLKINVVFDAQLIQQSEAEKLMVHFKQQIKEVIQHCLIVKQIKENNKKINPEITATSTKDSEAKEIQEFSI